MFIISCDDTVEVNTQTLYDEAADLYREGQYEASKQKIDLLLDAPDLGSSILIAKSYYLRGFIYYLNNESKEAYQDYLMALELAKEHGDEKIESRLYNEIGQIFYEKELYDQGLVYFQMALDHVNAATYQDRAYYNYGIGKSLKSLGRFDEAMEFLLEAIEINKQLNNNNSLIKNYLEMGSLHSRVGNYTVALEHFQKVIELAPLSQNPSNNMWKAYNNMGNAFLIVDKFEEAEVYLTQALEYNTNENQLWVTYNNLGRVYNKKGQYEKAWSCFKKSLVYNSEKGEMNELAITNMALKKTFQKLNQPDSLLYYTMLINDMALPLIETQAWLKDEDMKIALLTKYQNYKQKQSEREQYAKTSWLMAFIMTFVFVSGVLSMRLWKIYNYKSSQKGYDLIRNPNEMVYLLDLFKKEKEEMKKVMDQKIGGAN
ncbi:tetratricopeptide repeat protein [Reichenbachiella carrageenanivorans]|uniref:Tetratricopeptide repeat protein n=1 Tax=Reichenbachiella carrageenanivorans TaxID=2979869 RepID=A0ABY6CYH7_9BACT|nr:tetratricopeptide repeat protein [Reichenbachiella carrageenanivorans]UXX78962.1 tetratricopeptide repeat protein [Reichenbachiella carrageenanivorans]